MHDLELEFQKWFDANPELSQFFAATVCDGVWIKDLSGEYKDWLCHTFWQQLGYAEDETNLPDWQDCLSAEDAEHLEEHIANQLQSPAIPQEKVYQFKCKSQTLIPIMVKTFVKKASDHLPADRLIATFHNINRYTKLDPTQNESALTKQRIARIQNAVALGTWELNLETNELIWSEQVYQIFRVKPETFSPSYEAFMSLVHPQDREDLEQTFNNAIEKSEIYTKEHRLLFIDGTTRWVRETGHFEFDSTGKATHCIGTVQDITKEKIRELDLIQAQKQMQASSEAKSNFLANMSHELRTPLNAIIGLSELGTHLHSLQESTQNFHKIMRSAQIILGVFDDILDFSHIESGKLSINLEAFSLLKLSEDIQLLFKEITEEKNLNFTITLDPKLKQYYKGDAQRIRQVLINLLSNSIKFTTKGHIKINVVLEKESFDLSYLHFEVEDSGIGLTLEQVKRIFEPFEQADSSISREYGGTGLGLTICQNIVKAMGGHAIEVFSRPNEQTTFYFNLPLMHPSEEEIELAKVRDRSALTNTTNRLQGKVLVVEDLEINREIICNQLTYLGLTFSCATNGQEALDNLQHETFDAILMDIQMPVMDGISTARQIRAQGLSTPIIAITAAAMIEDRSKALEAGMNGHLAKPVKIQELFETLSEYLVVQSPTPISTPAEKKPKISEKTNEPSSNQVNKVTAKRELKNIFNLHEGLNQVNGKAALYIKLLKSFEQELEQKYQSLITDIDAIMAKPEQTSIQTLQVFNHSLKGLAGNLYATAMFEACQDLDNTLKAEEAPTTEQRDAFVNAFTATQKYLPEAIRSLEDKQPQAEISQIAERKVPQTNENWLANLIMDLRQHRYIDIDQQHTLTQQMTAEFSRADAEAVIHAIEDFEFTSAIQLINHLIEQRDMKQG